MQGSAEQPGIEGASTNSSAEIASELSQTAAPGAEAAVQAAPPEVAPVTTAAPEVAPDPVVPEAAAAPPVMPATRRVTTDVTGYGQDRNEYGNGTRMQVDAATRPQAVVSAPGAQVVEGAQAPAIGQATPESAKPAGILGRLTGLLGLGSKHKRP